MVVLPAEGSPVNQTVGARLTAPFCVGIKLDGSEISEEWVIAFEI
jgi:hypothetical protein